MYRPQTFDVDPMNSIQSVCIPEESKHLISKALNVADVGGDRTVDERRPRWDSS